MLNTENADSGTYADIVRRTRDVAVDIEKPMAGGLLSKAVIISFKTGRFGNTRKVRRSAVSISAYDVDAGEDRPVDKPEERVKRSDCFCIQNGLENSLQ